METKSIDKRGKSLYIDKHRSSDFTQYPLLHQKQGKVKKPFLPDEKGRQKSTEMLDHVIKQKKERMTLKMAVATKARQQDAYLQTFIEHKSRQIERKRQDKVN